MKFTSDRKALLDALTLAASVAERKSTFALLSNVLITVDRGVTITATDLNTMLTYDVAAGAKKETGASTVSASGLLDAVKALADGDVTIATDANKHVEVKSGRTVYRLPALPPDEFPKVPTFKGKWHPVSAAVIRDLIDRTAFAMCQDVSRAHMNVALWEMREDRLRMVCVDSSRLALAEDAAPGLTWDGMVQVPAKQLADLRRAIDATDGNVDVASDGAWLHVRAGGATIALKMPASTFPPYERVIPAKHERRALVPIADLSAALRRSSVVLSKATTWVTVRLDSSGLLVTAEDPTGGASSDECPCEYTGDSFTFGVSPRIMLDALGAVDGDKAELRIGGRLDPIVLVGNASDRVLTIAMPVNIDQAKK